MISRLALRRVALFAALALQHFAGLACSGSACPDGQEGVANPWSGGGVTCRSVSARSPDDSCFGLGCAWAAAGQSADVDAGIELADGGACPAAAGDDACVSCTKTACCTYALACFATTDGGVCSPTDPVGAPLAECLADNCAKACPGVP